MQLSKACWEMLANWDITLAWSQVEVNRETKRPQCVEENIVGDDWKRMLLERTRTRVEKRNGLKRVESRREGEVAWGGGEEKEQRNRKADVEEVGNWWSRKLGYSCCESMCASLCVNIRCVCVCVYVSESNDSKWNCLSDQYGHHLPDDCGLYWRAIINHNQMWKTSIHTNCECVRESAHNHTLFLCLW